MDRSFASNSRNSRFAAFNSRLGVNKFPFSRQREFAGKRLIYLAVVDIKTALSGSNRKNSRFHGKNRETSPGAAPPRRIAASLSHVSSEPAACGLANTVRGVGA